MSVFIIKPASDLNSFKLTPLDLDRSRLTVVQNRYIHHFWFRIEFQVEPAFQLSLEPIGVIQAIDKHRNRFSKIKRNS